MPARRSRKGRPLADKTLQDYNGQLARIGAALGSKSVEQITRRDVAEFLEPLPPTYRNRTRSLFHDLMAHAVAEGLCEGNPVDGTLKATEVVVRQRLTLDQYNAIYKVAPGWLQSAMQLALLTLQRRSDVVGLQHEDVRGGFLYVVQQKTGARLRIALNEALSAAIGEPGPVPWILWAEIRGKPRQLSADMLSKHFAKARDRVLRAKDYELGAMPTFHEIRALGARLMRDAGKDPQTLLGHIDPQTTRWYLDRHEVRWTEVEL